MVFVPRRFVYPFFTIIILLIFFAALFISYFNQALFVDSVNSSVSIIGDQVVIKIPMKNNSSHVLKDIHVVIKSEEGERTFFIKGNEADSFLLPDENYVFLTPLPLGESYSYTALVSAPFNRTVSIKIDLDRGTVDPVDAQVFLPADLILGKEYTYSVKLCNVSPSELAEVFWVESAEVGDFKENFFERTVSLEKDECKTIYSYLTPIRTGKITIGFALKVGALRKSVSKVLNVTAE